MRPKPEGGQAAHVYVCGGARFASRVLETIKLIFRRYERCSAAQANEKLYRLTGAGRLAQEIHGGARPAAPSSRRYDYSEIAQHNDEANGYWIAIEGVVYDVSELLHLHPGGRRILQLYAGMDATEGFARAHAGRADVEAARERYRIGLVRSPVFDDHAAIVEGPTGPVAVDRSSAYRAFVSALQLVVEMQNALAADQSLQTERVGRSDDARERTPYKLLRALETHQRFSASYLSVLASETLPGLWQISQGLLFPDASRAWMKEALECASQSEHAQQSADRIDRVAVAFESFKLDPRTLELVHALERLDRELLASLKAELTCALRELERPQQSSGADVRLACERIAALVRRYQSELTRTVCRNCRSSL